MIGLFCFALAVVASPFKSKLRLQAENAVVPVGNLIWLAVDRESGDAVV
jgi:hypothetical protein